MTTKAAIKASYIANLKATYAFYLDGSKPLVLAIVAADRALAGKIKLEGDCWYKALADNGMQKASTMKMLAALPN